jgi:hypothetical protein
MPVLITATAAAVAAGDATTFFVGRDPVTVSCDTLEVDESISIEYSATGVGWRDADGDDGAITLTSERHQYICEGAGFYRVDKPLTDNPVGVYIVSASMP